MTDFVQVFHVAHDDNVLLNCQKHFLWSPHPTTDGFYCCGWLSQRNKARVKNVQCQVAKNHSAACEANHMSSQCYNILHCPYIGYPQETKTKYILTGQIQRKKPALQVLAICI